MENHDQKEGKFFCSWEWHMARMLPLCSLVYSWSFRIAKKSKRFEVSAPSAADYFDRHRNTMYPVFDQLRETGFFIAVGTGMRGNIIYEPISHTKWKESHQGQCAIRVKKGTRLNAA